VIGFVHGLANLVDVKCIKCTCKGGDRTRFFGKIWKIMNSDQTARRLVPFVFFFPRKTVPFWPELGILTDFQFSPPAFNCWQVNP